MSLQFPAIDPIAIHITDGFGIHWYALAYLSGILGGWFYALKLVAKNRATNVRPHADDIDNIITWIVLGIVLGGRIGYVLFYNLGEYIQHPLHALFIWEGGMSFHGGLIGVTTAIVAYTWLNKFPILALGDVIAPVVPIGLFFGRIANFINGELFGRATDMPWGMVFPYGGEHPRHPSQIYEAFLEGIVLFTVMFIAARREDIPKMRGFLTGMFIAGYGVCRFLVEFVREPDVQIGYLFRFFSMGQLLSLPMVIIGLILICYARKKAA